MSVSQHHHARPFENDGRFEKVKRGTGKRRTRYLAFITHDGYAGTSYKMSRPEAYHAAIAEQARGRAEASKLGAEVDAGIARHAAACPKSPQLAPVVISPTLLATALASMPAAALRQCQDALIAGLDRISEIATVGGEKEVRL